VLDQRDQARAPEARRRERSRQRHPHGHVRREHLLGEQPRRFAQAPAVVREEGLIDQVRRGHVRGDRRRRDPQTAQVPTCCFLTLGIVRRAHVCGL
jgi:hypothetical protein